MPDTVPVTLPAMGESVTEGTLVEWHKKPGDAVTEGETLADVTTDKVDVEIPSPVSGVLTSVLAEEGATVAVGAVIAEISPGEASEAAAPNGDRPAARTVAPGEAQPPAAGKPAAAAPAEAAAGEDGPLVEVTLPAMGESVAEGTIGRFTVAVGDSVTAEQTVAEVTTDKVDVDVPAPQSGVVVELRGSEGDTVPVGGVIAVIRAGAAGLAPPTAAAPAPAATTPASPAPRPAAATPVSPAPAPAANAPTPEPAPLTSAPEPVVARAPAPVAARASATAATGSAPAVRGIDATDPQAFAVSPLARRRAALEGFDPESVRGSGPGGQVRSADVAAAVARRAPTTAGNGAAPTAPPVADGGGVPLRGPAAALAVAMEASREVPTATSFRTLEVGVLEGRRRQLNDALKASGRDEKVSFTHLIGYAIAQAASQQPALTHHFARTAEGKPVRVEPGIHLGIAVDTARKDGSRFLVVPVIRNAAQRDFQQFRSEYERLIRLARTGALQADDMVGASITLTNPGGLGTVASVPRLMAGSGSIIATGSIDHPPGLRGIAPERLRDLGVSKVMTMTSTYDHRVIQGAQSGEFLGLVDELLRTDDFYGPIFGVFGIRLSGLPTAVPAPGTPGPRTPLAATGGAPSHELLAAVSAGVSLVKGYRHFGHLAARLDPLGANALGDETMDEKHLGLTPELERAVPADVLRTYVEGDTLADVIPRLRETYCGTIAYQIEHLASHEQRLWLRGHIESGWHRRPLLRERRLVLLGRLTKVEAMERYLRKAFLGQKTFSIEGLDSMVPMLEELINTAAEDGCYRVVMGMAHRGRLAAVTHVANRTYESTLVAFEQGEQKRRIGEAPDDPTGDVKYHLGADGTYMADNGHPVAVKIVNNPSHLEIVNPVVEGWVRAEQTTRNMADLLVDSRRSLAVLIHGDAAFPAQGVVPETLNLSALQGYSVGGTVHVIANNQVGFTTDPIDSRSTRYASDLAKGFDIPIIHVNADDVEACIHAMRLAYEYRRTFSRDVLVDLIGYRRFGHNETDEPVYTQPLMYERIKAHPTARELYARRLVDEGLITEAQADAQFESAYTRIQQAHHNVKETMAVAEEERPERPHEPLAADLEIATGVAADSLKGILTQLGTAPETFQVNRKLAAQLQRRNEQVKHGEVDWATAESLAFGSLLLQGVPIRLTGQDTERGTFSQRHLVFHDAVSGGQWTPMQHLVGANAAFEVHNSPLSEEAAMGFEYGYSVAANEALVLWEAQFGDFVNGAQVVIDQFISAGEAKWGNRSRLSLLLPHSYEGSGPEHSSARLERFLQLSANGNWRVANCSTAAQYFHLLRMQALAQHPRPLIVMTPKSLLRSPLAASPLEELSSGHFHNVIDDPTIEEGRREAISTLLLCTGKIYHDLMQSPWHTGAISTAIARVEMLDPLPLDDIIAVVKSYPNLAQLFWVQEEPKNMGAWNHINRPVGRMRPYHIRWDYIGRPRRASTSEGFHGAHIVEQERILREALDIGSTPREEALAAARKGSKL